MIPLMKPLRPWQVVLVYAGLLAVALAFRFDEYDGQWTGFICFGNRFFRAAELPPNTKAPSYPDGYDGQFYYAIAGDPFATGDGPRHVDAPAYRYQRILYPLAARVAALGQRAWLPVTMVLVNVAALLWGTWLVAGYLQRHGQLPQLALVFGLTSGLLLALYRDLTDVLAVTLLVASFVAHDRQRHGWSAAALALAALARETMIVAAPLLAAEHWFRRRDARAVACVVLACLPFIAWQGYVAYRFQTWSWAAGAGSMTWPLTGIISSPVPRHQVYLVLSLVALAIVLVLAARACWRQRTALPFTMLAMALLPLLLNRDVWVEPWAYGRVLAPAMAMAVLTFGREPNRWYGVVFGVNLALVVAT